VTDVVQVLRKPILAGQLPKTRGLELGRPPHSLGVAPRRHRSFLRQNAGRNRSGTSSPSTCAIVHSSLGSFSSVNPLATARKAISRPDDRCKIAGAPGGTCHARACETAFPLSWRYPHISGTEHVRYTLRRHTRVNLENESNLYEKCVCRPSEGCRCLKTYSSVRLLIREYVVYD
jgi:hypothetical protein